MTIQEKYKLNRPILKDGDVIFFSGIGIVARIIRWCDNSKYSHIGIIVEKHGALFIVDANASGVQADRLSWRIKKYDAGADFTVVRSLESQVKIDSEMYHLLRRSDEKWIKYDFKNGIKELCNRKFGTHFKIYLNDERDICSDFISQYQIYLEMVTDVFKDKTIVFPEDGLRYINNKNVSIVV